MKPRAGKGFTLLEAVISLALFAVISVSVLPVWQYASRQSLALLTSADAFENARAAMDAFLVNIQLAEEITLKTDVNGRLSLLTLRELDPDGYLHDYVFSYNAGARRLDFGSNEFASQLSEVRLTKDGDLLNITVSTGGEAPVTLNCAADIRHKVYREG